MIGTPALLEAIVADPDAALAGCRCSSEAERQRLLVEWNDTEAEYPRTCVHELFEAQARAPPTRWP